MHIAAQRMEKFYFNGAASQMMFLFFDKIIDVHQKILTARNAGETPSSNALLLVAYGHTNPVP